MSLILFCHWPVGGEMNPSRDTVVGTNNPVSLYLIVSKFRIVVDPLTKVKLH